MFSHQPRNPWPIEITKETNIYNKFLREESIKDDLLNSEELDSNFMEKNIDSLLSMIPS